MILFFLSCSSGPQNYAEIGNKTACATQDISCQMKECTDFFASPPPVDTPQKQEDIARLCSALESKNHPATQACAVPACYMLANVHPQAALTQLTKGYARNGGQKIARQTIIRGIIDQGGLHEFLSSADGADTWLNIMVLEALCEESSSAKQLNRKCAPADAKAAQAAWDLAQKFPSNDPSHHSALNLAMILDSKGMAPLLLSLTLDPKADTKNRAAAAQALNLGMNRGYTLSTEFVEIIQKRCLQGDPPLKHLCFSRQISK